MVEKQFKEGETFTVNGHEFKVLSVAQHEVEGEPAGFSYSIRPVEDALKDDELAKAAEEKAASDAEAQSTPNETENEEDE